MRGVKRTRVHEGMLNNGKIDIRVLVARVTNVRVREDNFFENRAIHGLKDRIQRSKLQNQTFFENFLIWCITLPPVDRSTL